MPQRGIEEIEPKLDRRRWRHNCVWVRRLFEDNGQFARHLAFGDTGIFFDAPLGHDSIPRANRGRQPLARSCPRLISCGVPPGRSARRRRPVSDGLMVANATAIPPRRQFLPAHFLAPNSPAQPGRTHEPMRPAVHAGRLPCDCGAFPSAPSVSAFFPISAVVGGNAPRVVARSGTPQRSE